MTKARLNLNERELGLGVRRKVTDPQAELSAQELRVLEERLTEGARRDQHERTRMSELGGQVALDQRATRSS